MVASARRPYYARKKRTTMSRSVTMKTVQQHIQCVCGHNIVTSEQWQETGATLKALGFKRRRADMGGYWYVRSTVDEVCPGEHMDDDFFND